jgi:multidrug resistance efflux pump
MSSTPEGGSGKPRRARGAPVGTVIVGRPCHSVGAWNEVIRAAGGHPSARSHEASDVLVVALASTLRQARPGSGSSTAHQPLELASSPLRITQGLGAARQTGPEPDGGRPAPKTASPRVQSLALERSLAEALHGHAQRARARRRAFGLESLGVPGAGAPVVPPLGTRPAAGQRWIVALASLGGLVLAGLTLPLLPVTLHAPGVLLGVGVQSVEPALAGVVEEVLLEAGAEVAQGQLLMRLAPATRASGALTLRERELEALRRATSRAKRADSAALAEWTRAAERQRAALTRRRDMAMEQREQQASALARYHDAVAEGLARPADERAARDAISVADSAVATLDEQLGALALRLAERHHDGQHRERERTRELQRALAAVEEARAARVLSEVRSPIAGRIQAVLVVPGARVLPGMPVAQVVPAGATSQVVAFVPARDAHLVHVGMAADVAVDAAHAAGAARARVIHVSDGSGGILAQAAARAGANELCASVELALLDEANPDSAAAGARSGERLQVRLHGAEPRWRSTLETWWQG